MRGIWKEIFKDDLYSEGKIPDKETRKLLYDRCYRRARKKLRKELGRKPTKTELYEEVYDCLTSELYEWQLRVGEISKQKRRRKMEKLTVDEFLMDVRSLNRLNRNFWGEGETEEDREEQRKKDKKWIEQKVREESGYTE